MMNWKVSGRKYSGLNNSSARTGDAQSRFNTDTFRIYMSGLTIIPVPEFKAFCKTKSLIPSHDKTRGYILLQTNPVHLLIAYFLNTHLNVIPPSIPWSST